VQARGQNADNDGYIGGAWMGMNGHIGVLCYITDTLWHKGLKRYQAFSYLYDNLARPDDGCSHAADIISEQCGASSSVVPAAGVVAVWGQQQW
jgi:hypothetical protein